MTDPRKEGIRVLRELLPGVIAEGEVSFADGKFGEELGELTLTNVFGSLWNRLALSRRDRSLVTLGILIALRAEGELEVHFSIGLRNGLTVEELEEVVYHSSAYAGFPAAATARQIAIRTLPKAGDLP
ncbi:carboxymuconolactone decarboxylase [Subtercola boreus]|uniref:Carboxymuconolactone decarboxylase n=1 Tax=Subtercola boreus TaxID=120213 RepID=A0A3E0VBL6_9MICO|nr:carboxymuconolactone decarboxylase family protein [Subtercola boreus]RFA06898.1 carboxymuconolactone decarboxylase [Subtercola boreus]